MYSDERTAKMKPVLDRIPDSWGKYLPDEGWDELLLNLDAKLSLINPDYEIHQAKEKFGTLRFYTDFDYGTPASDLILDAEALSAYTCEKCGAADAKGRVGGWIKTLCDDCHERKNDG